MKKSILFLSVFFLSFASLLAQKSPSLKIMTYNLRYDNPDDGINAWPKRNANVALLIKKYNPDLLGIQEGLHHQLRNLDSLLKDYAWVGVGRDDGKTKGEYAAIFYRKSRFKLLDQGSFWLSETPAKAGSIGWDAACVRIVSWAKFFDKMAKRVVFHFNTHFDYKGIIAQRESAALLAKMADSIAKNEAKIYTGDFNTPITDSCMIRLISPAEKYPVKDSRQISANPSSGPNYSYVSFDPDFTPTVLIDHILVSKQFNVKTHHVCNEKYGNWYPSDHLAVVVELGWQ